MIEVPVTFGPRVNEYSGGVDGVVEDSLRRAALCDKVRDRLHKSVLALSGGQQQRLCITRALAAKPEVIHMNESRSAVDPITTRAIEDLIRSLTIDYTIVIVTHNMQQAAQVSDETAFLTTGEDGVGYLVEYGHTRQIFTYPNDQRIKAYIHGEVQLRESITCPRRGSKAHPRAPEGTRHGFPNLVSIIRVVHPARSELLEPRCATLRQAQGKRTMIIGTFGARS